MLHKLHIMDWEQILVVALALFTFWDKVRQERYKTRMDREGVKQEKEHTVQEQISTQEKDFDLARRSFPSRSFRPTTPLRASRDFRICG